MALVAGIDASRDAWIGVTLRRGRFDRAIACARFDALLAALAGVDVIAVDMPIGLVARGWRSCDVAARAALGARASTVFLVPPRAVLSAGEYGEANARCRGLTGQGVSKQAYALAPRILELDAHRADRRLYEAHPELAFQAMTGRALVSKKTWHGVTARRAALASVGVVLPDDVGDAGRAAPDDVLDAAAMAWTAQRIASGEAVALHGEPKQRDGRRVLAIWA